MTKEENRKYILKTILEPFCFKRKSTEMQFTEVLRNGLLNEFVERQKMIVDLDIFHEELTSFKAG